MTGILLTLNYYGNGVIQLNNFYICDKNCRIFLVLSVIELFMYKDNVKELIVKIYCGKYSSNFCQVREI